MGKKRVADLIGPDIPTGEHLLEMTDVAVEFQTDYGIVNAVNGISYTLDPGGNLAILGESGSGKTVSALALMGLIQEPGKVTSGQIKYKGVDLLTLPDSDRRAIRGAEIAMIFQDALSALNPVFSVGDQIAEMFQVHRGMSKKDSYAKALELMDRVRIPSAKERLRDYPHQFSGGMRQRVMIAIGISLNPAILIADEPSTALDVTVQAQIMQLLSDLQKETQMGLILITHDLGVVAEVADYVCIMYAGKLVEKGTVEDIYGRPAHPYTECLMNSIPRVDRKGDRLDPIKGSPPSLQNIPSGCPFHPRCPRARLPKCQVELPELREVSGERLAACHFAEEVLGASV
ncbi:MAG: ABC transporter ATP-binding protein [Actinomycetota bacterium]